MIVAVIPAKGKSKRLPNKNLLKINGKTLIEYAVMSAKRSRRIKAIYVSTDSREIAEHAEELGVNIIMRGEELGDETPLIEVYRHAYNEINNNRVTHIVGLQPDNPDRNSDVDDAIDYSISNNIDNLFTVDGRGRRNGGLNIFNLNALKAKPFSYPAVIKDDCINIHSTLDFQKASRNLSHYSDTISIANRKVGKGEPVFIIAEAACNHMCKIDMAREMIARASDAGVDAIKFQTYKAEKLVTGNAISFWGKEKISQLEYYKRLDRFGKEEYKKLFAYARERGIIAFSSPFDAESAEMLADLDMPLFKIASCDIPDLEHLKHIAGFGKPIILSTGASTSEEIDRAVETIFRAGNYQLMLLACTLSYPTKNEDANLLRIKTLKDRYPGMVIGLSDHTEPDPCMIIPSIAAALGAKIIEKHYTLDRSMTGSGHFFAVDPNNLKRIVNNIRLTETILGDGYLGVSVPENEAWQNARRSIVTEGLINKGDVITREMIGLKRPGDGLQAHRIKAVLGKRAKRKMKPNQQIRLEDLE